MPYKLIKIMHKLPEDTWDNVYIGDVSKALNTKEPDPRDNSSYNDEEKEVFKSQIKVLSEFKGYLGWDREYVGETELHLIKYFDTEENMIAHYHYSRNIDQQSHTNSTIKRKLLNVTYKFKDDNGNDIEV